MRPTRTQGLLAAVTLLLVAGGIMPGLRSSAWLENKREAFVHLPERLITRFLPPKGGNLDQLTEPERETVRHLSRRLNAQIVWSSNRGGNHDLYLLDLKSQSLRRLTTDPHVDFFSRFSPDGRKIVFMRSQLPWVSFRDESQWDVYVMNVDGNGERRLARGGYAPSWSPDGGSVVFSRGGRVIRLSLTTGREEILLDADRELSGARIGNGNLSFDGRMLALSVYLRGSLDGVALYDLGSHRLTPVQKEEACEISWGPDGSLVWIGIGGSGGTRVMRMSGGRKSVLMDLPGKYSHEYFPKISNDGHWLIWGAAAEGHEHDRADYEIFLWEVGSRWEDAIRLTDNSSNDQWPDIYVKH